MANTNFFGYRCLILNARVILIESFARAIPGSAKQRIEKNMIFSILQNQMLITFDFGGASLYHEILHFVQKSRTIIPH
uniref:Uncharacterized protein n=1 Tax=Candidatus Kentrum sp. LPFa TaxID=2126335 RepID=A0A450WIY2_9GAMM|nr:MAG: hypothetical protein BECKLPF1236A_GA0070988_101595 [Candidatus Kentron sp. LPFa]VFK32161.1 MAG: hypothetical protein BECKLPF1236C_GA0070990_101595 [Candidatus Kentron sp. LPFa]